MKKVELHVSKISDNSYAPGCPRLSENECGVMYRSY